MSTNIETKNEVDNELKLNIKLSESAVIAERYKLCVSPNSDSDDNANTNQIATQGFERFRNSSVTSLDNSKRQVKISAPMFSPPRSDSIAEYCAESFYSYSFTPLSRVNKAAKIKRQILSRGMDYMQRIRYNTKVRDTMRRFSQPDIGVLDQTNDWADVTVQDTPSKFNRSSLNDNHHNLNTITVPPHDKQSINNKKLDELLNSDKINDDFYLSRRQTIDLPPIYEAPQTTTSKLPCDAHYSRALHAPSRFLPQNQAILTTDADTTILLFNHMAGLCFGIDKSCIGKSILDELEDPFKSQISNLLKHRRKATHENKGHVLVCGVVVPIRKMNGESISAASLWLKEKRTEEGKTVYIWIFEEIYETSLSTYLDEQGNVTKMIGTAKELFGYTSSEIIGKPITQFIPALSGAIKQRVAQVKYYGGKSKSGLFSPVMVTSSTSNLLKIVSLPSIAGLITVHNSGIIQSINRVPAKYLFGYSPDSLIEKVNIDKIIPNFSKIVAGLRRLNFLQYSNTVNNHACRWAISEMCNEDSFESMGIDQSLRTIERQPSLHPNGQQRLPIIHAVHRDGSKFEIQVQLRLVEFEEEDLISIWVTYDRIHAQKRIKKKQDEEKKIRFEETIPVPVTPVKELYSHPLSPTNDHGLYSPISPIPINNKTEHVDKPFKRSYGISSYGSVDQKKALFPGGLADSRATKSDSNIHNISSDILNKPKKQDTIDDYVIVGTLGEGAYGTVKLAYRKDDVTKANVVIKFIAKSKIVVDSWIRDRKLGLVPLEIHILKKLKEHPHVNCSALETYMEDEDTYYLVTELYGENSMDLFDYIELNEHMQEKELRNIFRQVAQAVDHLQNLCIVHRDIKDENILLDESGCIHLIDFGSAAYFRKGRTFDTFSGTLDYCAPEILKGMSYEGPAQDIWSLGILLYTLIYRETPFYNVDEILEHELRIPFVMSEDSLNLIRKMLDRDVKKRYTIHEVLKHPWLASA